MSTSTLIAAPSASTSSSSSASLSSSSLIQHHPRKIPSSSSSSSAFLKRTFRYDTLRDEKRWYWLLLLSSSTSLVLCLLELLLGVHLLLDDTWAALDVFVLQLGVWILIGLALSGMCLSIVQMWCMTYLVEASALLGVKEDATSNSSNSRRARNRGRLPKETKTVTLLTDSSAATASTSTTPTTSTRSLPSSKSQLNDESIVGSQEQEDESENTKEAIESRALRALLREEEGTEESSHAASAESKDMEKKTADETKVTVAESSEAAAAAGAANGNNEEESSEQPFVQVERVQVNEHSSINAGPSSNPATASSHRVSSSYSSSFQSSPHLPPDNILTTSLHFSVLLLILYYGFSILVLAQRQEVADYVHSHALQLGIVSPSLTKHAHGMHHHSHAHTDFSSTYATSAADILQTQLVAYLAVMGILTLFSSKLLTFSAVSTWIIQQKPRPTAQSYLLIQFVSGVSGCILLSLHLYSLHHHTFLPLRNFELNGLGIASGLLIVTCVGGLWRIHVWRGDENVKGVGINRSYHSSSSSSSSLTSSFTSSLPRLFHLCCLISLTFLLLLLSLSLWSLTKAGPYFDHSSTSALRHGSGGSASSLSDEMTMSWQKELETQLKIAALSAVTLITCIYTLINFLISVQLDGILASASKHDLITS